MQRKRFAILLFMACSPAAAENWYSPPHCEFAVEFPVAPYVAMRAVKEPAERNAREPEVAQTPDKYLPWLVAQCWPSAHPGNITLEDREGQVKLFLEQHGAKNIVVTSETTPLGAISRGQGEVNAGSVTLTYTAQVLVGSKSFLLTLAADGPVGHRAAIQSRFFNSVRRSVGTTP